MERLLQEIHGVVGVTGAFVTGPDGELLASTMPADFDAKVFSLVARTFTRTFEGLRMARRRKVTEMDLVFDGGRLIAKNLAHGCLVILCAPTINVPLLNLTANVIARKVAQQLKPTEAAPPKAVEAPAAPAAAAARDVLQRMREIVHDRMGEDGVEFFENEISRAGLRESPSPELLDRLLQELDTPLSLAIGGRGARQLVKDLRSALEGAGG